MMKFFVSNTAKTPEVCALHATEVVALFCVVEVMSQ